MFLSVFGSAESRVRTIYNADQELWVKPKADLYMLVKCTHLKWRFGNVCVVELNEDVVLALGVRHVHNLYTTHYITNPVIYSLKPDIFFTKKMQ